MSSTVPRSILGLIDRPTVSIPVVAVSIPVVAVSIPTVAVGSVSNFDASDFVGMFSRPKDIVGGVSPDSFCNRGRPQDSGTAKLAELGAG